MVFLQVPQCFNTNYQYDASQIADAANTAALIQAFVNFMNQFGRTYGVSISSTNVDLVNSMIGACLTINDNSKNWLTLMFNLFQFGLFHFVMIMVTRIFYVGL